MTAVAADISLTETPAAKVLQQASRGAPKTSGAPSSSSMSSLEPSRPSGRSPRPEAKRCPAFGGRATSLVVLTAVCVAVFTADLLAFGRGMPDGLLGILLRTASEALGESNLGAEVTLVVCLSALAFGFCGGPRKSTQQTKVQRKTAGKMPPRSLPPAKQSPPSAAAAAPAVRRGAAASKVNQAIDAAARAGDALKAVQLILEFEQLGGALETVSYNLGLRACAKAGDLREAEFLVKHMESRGVTPTLCSYNTLLDVCAKADNAEACEEWLQVLTDRGLEPNVISYATAIYARARRGDVHGAEGWLKRMLDAGVEPDAVSYNSVIHACGVTGNAAKAEHWLREMQVKGLDTSVATFTAVIDACAKSNDVDGAEAWLEEMIRADVQPNVVTFSAMIDACAKTGNLLRAEYWHDRMVAAGVKPNAHSFSAVINACKRMASAEGAEAAERWLERSEEAGFSNDVVVYSTVIDACGKSGDAERAMRIFNRMRSRGLKPHIVAYAALARPFAYRGDWIKVESIAQMMSADGVVPNEYFLYAQLLAYGVARPRQAERAEVCFRDALAARIKANDHVIGALSRAVGRNRCAELMRELCGGREVPTGQLRHSRGGQGRGRAEAGPARG